MTSEVSGETSVLHDIKSLLSRHTPRGPRTRISTFPTFRARRSDTPRQGEKSKPRQPPARFYGEWCTTGASTAYILRTARCKPFCPPGTCEVTVRHDARPIWQVSWRRCVLPPPKPIGMAPPASCASRRRVGARVLQPRQTPLSGSRGFFLTAEIRTMSIL